MENKFKYTSDNKRYHTLTYYYKEKFNSKVCKVSLNANFTCPNIDGKVGIGGCIYCSKLGSGEYAGNPKEDLITQFEKGKKTMQRKWPNAKFIAYFQANTNTYAPIERLKECFEPFINRDDCIGLSIATRSDSITDECLDYLEDISKRTYLIVELGLQTIHEKTSKLINRCSSLDNFDKMVKRLKERNINVVVHIINGLPYETEEMMIDTVKHLNDLNIDGIKIHMLGVLKDTPLEKYYQKHKFHILTKEEYVNIVVKQLEYLNPKIVIHRLTEDPKKEDIIEPTWLTKKFTILNEVDKIMSTRNLYQGDKLKEKMINE
ncbi:MAG TPA: TIGR01212 family radical SAM protein [Candidatus Onthousia excrementipullorum]|uniref:TIGR01212 family radical SAM protein n=1 Tax=Candidatus Onthousia excrementipullorum TaxID=2840884 RepID=A0A9D1DSV6_9FIRM|nr:TIGR01212 family radical SAM protein [Candidatus Onthousia excrementipullorum]